jgi:NAD(P)-dependent dehydrogenase (short-subunit alcohol dehydrogenase family)
MTKADPRTAEPRPPLPAQEQEPPGTQSQMRPEPDTGVERYVGQGRLEGKKAIVTGADSGIGRAVALAFAREGADVLISYLIEDDDAAETARLVRDAGRQALLVGGDIALAEHCTSIVDRAVGEWGRIDILVNNAAQETPRDGIGQIPDEEWEDTFRVNVQALFRLCQGAMPHMPPGSTIINTASIQAAHPSPTLLTYASTKGAIVTFTKALAQEAIKQGIRVNAVAPGPIWTPLIVSTGDPDSVANFGKKTSIGRAGQPAELAPAYVFLADNAASSYIVGATIPVTGGEPFD